MEINNECCGECLGADSTGTNLECFDKSCPCHLDKKEDGLTELLEKAVDLFGFDNKEGTYWYILGRVKEARLYGTLTIDDFEEIDDETIKPIMDLIKKSYSLGEKAEATTERERVEGDLEKLRDKIDFNCHNLGEFGKVCKFEYINNFITDLLNSYKEK